MQKGENPTVDANAVHPPEIQDDDPRNLKNLMINVHKLNSQSSADTKYDPPPPPRVDKNGKEVNEAFAATLDTPDIKLIREVLFALGALATIVLIMVIFCYLDPKLYRSISEVQNGLTYIGIAAVLSTINIGLIYFSMRTNEIILWYPPLAHARVWY